MLLVNEDLSNVQQVVSLVLSACSDSHRYDRQEAYHWDICLLVEGDKKEAINQ